METETRRGGDGDAERWRRRRRELEPRRCALRAGDGTQGHRGGGRTFSTKPDSEVPVRSPLEGVLGVFRETVCRYLSAGLNSKRSAVSFNEVPKRKPKTSGGEEAWTPYNPQSAQPASNT